MATPPAKKVHPAGPPLTRGLTVGARADAQVALSKLSEEELRDIEQVFKLFDTSGDGKIDRGELFVAMRSLGQDVAEKDIENLMAQVDYDNSGSISLVEFQQVMGAAKVNQDVEEQLRVAFQRFDVDGDGYISEADLMRAMSDLGQPLTHQDCDIVLNDSKFDINSDGRMSFPEFIEFMCEHSGAH